MVLPGDEAQVELILVHLEMPVVLVQDRCMFCAKRTSGSEIVLDGLDGTTR